LGTCDQAECGNAGVVATVSIETIGDNYTIRVVAAAWEGQVRQCDGNSFCCGIVRATMHCTSSVNQVSVGMFAQEVRLGCNCLGAIVIGTSSIQARQVTSWFCFGVRSRASVTSSTARCGSRRQWRLAPLPQQPFAQTSSWDFPWAIDSHLTSGRAGNSRICR
jgi:hypothetical protein